MVRAVSDPRESFSRILKSGNRSAILEGHVEHAGQGADLAGEIAGVDPRQAVQGGVDGEAGIVDGDEGQRRRAGGQHHLAVDGDLAGNEGIPGHPSSGADAVDEHIFAAVPEGVGQFVRVPHEPLAERGEVALEVELGIAVPDAQLVGPGRQVQADEELDGKRAGLGIGPVPVKRQEQTAVADQGFDEGVDALESAGPHTRAGPPLTGRRAPPRSPPGRRGRTRVESPSAARLTSPSLPRNSRLPRRYLTPSCSMRSRAQRRLDDAPGSACGRRTDLRGAGSAG